jgi:hypothetical protein
MLLKVGARIIRRKPPSPSQVEPEPGKAASVLIFGGRTLAGRSPKAKSRGKTGKKPPRHEQNHEATADEFEREGMGIASKE